MKRTEIINQATLRTENKAPDLLDLDILFAQVCQEFCGENRFPWRRVTFSFNTVGGTATYDLTAIATTPSIAGLEIEEIEAILRVDSSISFSEVVPVTDPVAIAQALENSTSDTPGGYFFVPGQFQVMQFDVIPKAAYKMRVIGWAIPSDAVTENAADAVLLIPANYHRGIQYGMEREIWRVIYGPEDPKFLSADAAFKKVVAQASARKRFTTKYTEQSVVSDAGYGGNQVDVLRSTR